MEKFYNLIIKKKIKLPAVSDLLQTIHHPKSYRPYLYHHCTPEYASETLDINHFHFDGFSYTY